jgi:hypothetical protein
MGPAVAPQRIVDEDGATVEVFALPTDAESLEALMRDLFTHHWHEITFGPIIQGAAWEMRAAAAPERIAMFDGYLTVAFGVPHFHICIGEHKGPHNNPVAPELAHHRRTARAELYRRLTGEMTVLLPNPFLDAETDKVLRTPDWTRLALWDKLRARWLGLTEPDAFDRSGTGFRHH